MTPYTDRILDRLTRLHPKKIDLVLDRIQHVLAALDHPEDKLPPVIHVGGTNGKGSVIAFLGAMLRAEGYSVHVYTSPHLVRFHERIVIGKRASGGSSGGPIGDAELEHVLGACEEANGGAPLTFFEITTAAALLAFSIHEADVVLVEVGLGGRYDATNVIGHPAATLITPIGYDHTEFLGDTLARIAFEKAGILKTGVPALVGPQDGEALRVIENQAALLGVPLRIHGQDFFSYEQQGRLIFEDNDGLLDLPLPCLKGRHQFDNAGLAIACLRQLPSRPVSGKAMDAGLALADWPGRLQHLTASAVADLSQTGSVPDVWLDGGHNPMAAQALASAMAELEESNPRPLYLIVSMLKNKDIEGFLAPFCTLASGLITLPLPGAASGADPRTICTAAAQVGLPCRAGETLTAAFSMIAAMEARKALALSASDTPDSPRILICGSLYLAGHVLALLKNT